MEKLKKEKILIFFSRAFIFFLFLIIIFSRSLLGVYLYGFRVGELMVGFSLLGTLVALSLYRNKIKYFYGKHFYISHILLVATFLIAVLLSNASLLDTYLYRASSYIWAIFYLYFGLLIFNYFKINEKISIFLNWILIVIYFLQANYFVKLAEINGMWKDGNIDLLDISDPLLRFFTKYSDKFEPYKGTDILLFFALILFINNRYAIKSKLRFYFFLLASSAYLPLFLVRSRAATFCAIIFIIYELYLLRDNLKKIVKRDVGVFLLTLLLFVLSSYNMIGYQATDSSEIFQRLIQEKTPELSGKFLEFSGGRIYSADGNLNWRLAIWQDVIFDLNNKGKLLTGYGYSEIIPAMESSGRQGRDGLNQNVHNFVVNILARGGIIHLVLFIYMFLNLFKLSRNNFGEMKITMFLIPLLTASLFDASMENVHFPLFLYIFISNIVIEKID